jgi:hypothetical protein
MGTVLVVGSGRALQERSFRIFNYSLKQVESAINQAHVQIFRGGSSIEGAPVSRYCV